MRNLSSKWPRLRSMKVITVLITKVTRTTIGPRKRKRARLRRSGSVGVRRRMPPNRWTMLCIGYSLMMGTWPIWNLGRFSATVVFTMPSEKNYSIWSDGAMAFRMTPASWERTTTSPNSLPVLRLAHGSCVAIAIPGSTQPASILSVPSMSKCRATGCSIVSTTFGRAYLDLKGWSAHPSVLLLSRLGTKRSWKMMKRVQPVAAVPLPAARCHYRARFQRILAIILSRSLN
mmetsp:Transcript_31323/g.69393  ORF Transcript_31323/g.69393 Transcript_31323/m.69393 type:complete len:231 (+) Transcript_31323:1039-1731(+)